MPALWERATRADSLLAPPAACATAAGRPPFAGLLGGVGRLPDLLVAALSARRAVVRTGSLVRALERTAEGWRLVIGSAASPDDLVADAVVLAVPSAPAARLLAGHAPTAAAVLADVETASTAVVTLAVPPRRRSPSVEGSGFLVPPVEGRAIKAATFSFRKWGWTGALDPDLVHLRASLGRAREEAVLQREDADLVALAVADVAAALGRDPFVVADAHVQRWGGGLPQYAVGHVDAVAAVRADVARVPGLEVAGATYDGVGVPAVIASAARAATATATYLSTLAPRPGDQSA